MSWVSTKSSDEKQWKTPFNSGDHGGGNQPQAWCGQSFLGGKNTINLMGSRNAVNVFRWRYHSSTLKISGVIFFHQCLFLTSFRHFFSGKVPCCGWSLGNSKSRLIVQELDFGSVEWFRSLKHQRVNIVISLYAADMKTIRGQPEPSDVLERHVYWTCLIDLDDPRPKLSPKLINSWNRIWDTMHAISDGFFPYQKEQTWDTLLVRTGAIPCGGFPQVPFMEHLEWRCRSWFQGFELGNADGTMELHCSSLAGPFWQTLGWQILEVKTDQPLRTRPLKSQ